MKIDERKDLLDVSYKCYNDFSYFIEEILDYKMGDFHKEEIESLFTHRYNAKKWSVGHSKTTIFSVAYPIWRMWREKDKEIALISSSLEQTMKTMGIIQRTIDSNPFLKHLIPKNKHTAWNKSSIITSNGNQCYVKPFNDTARGIHPNYLILDDILRENDMPMETIKNIFWRVFFPRVQIKRGQFIVVGTPVSADDLFYDLNIHAKNHPGMWASSWRPAVVTDDTGKWLKAQWHERFSLDELRAIRDVMGEYNFNREYMCNPEAYGSSIFSPTMIGSCMDYDMSFTRNTKGMTMIGADFAMSDSPTGDFNVYTVVDHYVGEHPKKYKDEFGAVHNVIVKNPVIVRFIKRYKSSVGQVNDVHKVYEDYSPRKVILDESTFGQRFKQELIGRGISVEGQGFSAPERNKILLGLRLLMESDNPVENPPRLVIPGSESDGTFATTQILVKELGGFQQKKTKGGISSTLASELAHDDMVMSLAMAVKDFATIRSSDFSDLIVTSDELEAEGYGRHVDNISENEPKKKHKLVI